MLNQLPIPKEKAIPSYPAGTYKVNECFYSLQGEGRLAGTPMVFVRFTDCNLRCSMANAGFDCDTEFTSGRNYTCAELLAHVETLAPRKGWVLFTGGEPGLQLDAVLLSAVKEAGWMTAIETNGTVALPDGLDWICVSPKSAEHTIRQRRANEVKYVRSEGMAIPESAVKAEHYLISPAFQPDGTVRKQDLAWCVNLVKENSPRWSLTMQYHKVLGVR